MNHNYIDARVRGGAIEGDEDDRDRENGLGSTLKGGRHPI